MRIALASAFILLLSAVSIAQDTGIQFQDYPMKINWKKAELAELPNPEAITDCNKSELEWISVDKVFSGGENGVLERTWIAEDACGNKASTVQYIVLKD